MGDDGLGGGPGPVDGSPSWRSTVAPGESGDEAPETAGIPRV